MQDVRKQLAKEITVPIKVAVMGCVVNGPGECEGADIAIFAGDRKGIIYVQGERVANVPEEEILDRLLDRMPPIRGQGQARRSQARREKGRHPPSRPHRRTGQRLGKGREGSKVIAGGELNPVLGRHLVEPTRKLIDAIYGEKVLRSRRMTPQRRIEVGAELSDMGRQMMREAIRRQNPSASDDEIHQEMRHRLKLARKLEQIPLPESR